jgi:DNA-binding transcriptional ArsR family regulator
MAEKSGKSGSHAVRAVSTEQLYDLSELYKVFGDSTRIRILYALFEKELCVFHLSMELNMGRSAVSHQLRILRSAGLVRPRRCGKEVYYSLDDEHVREIIGAGLKHINHKQAR